MSLSPWQIEKELLSLALAQAWPDGSQAKILAAAVISTKPARELVGQLTSPFAAISYARARTDDVEVSRYSEGEFTVEIAVENWSDPYGAGASAGGTLENTGSSGGRGVDEVLSELEALLGPFVDSTHGFAGHARATERTETIDGVVWAFKKITVTARNASLARYYHTAFNFAGSAPGSGVANLSWVLPPSLRFDLYQVIVRRSNVGGAAPQTITDGNAVAVTGGNLGTSASVSGLAVGTYQFSIFGAYDDVNPTPTAAQRYSSPLSISLAVT